MKLERYGKYNQGSFTFPLTTIDTFEALACLLFNIALEKVISDSQVNTLDTLLHKSDQLLEYADDNDIAACSLTGMKKEAARPMGLHVNVSKTKIKASQPPDKRAPSVDQNFTIVESNFEVVTNFN